MQIIGQVGFVGSGSQITEDAPRNMNVSGSVRNVTIFDELLAFVTPGPRFIPKVLCLKRSALIMSNHPELFSGCHEALSTKE